MEELPHLAWFLKSSYDSEAKFEEIMKTIKLGLAKCGNQGKGNPKARNRSNSLSTPMVQWDMEGSQKELQTQNCQQELKGI